MLNSTFTVQCMCKRLVHIIQCSWFYRLPSAYSQCELYPPPSPIQNQFLHLWKDSTSSFPPPPPPPPQTMFLDDRLCTYKPVPPLQEVQTCRVGALPCTNCRVGVVGICNREVQTVGTLYSWLSGSSQAPCIPSSLIPCLAVTH